MGADVVAAVESCLDEKGGKLVDIATGDVTVTLATAATTSIAITLPEGKDGTKLDVIGSKGTVGTVTRTINKNNNGRSFKVKRVKHFVDNDLATSSGATTTAESTTTIKFALKHNVAPFAVGDEIKCIEQLQLPHAL